MKSSTYPTDSIEVIDEGHGHHARIRVREAALGVKASVFLTPDELDAHALECTALATAMRVRR